LRRCSGRVLAKRIPAAVIVRRALAAERLAASAGTQLPCLARPPTLDSVLGEHPWHGPTVQGQPCNKKRERRLFIT
jgi:hypothetical protein